MGLIRIRTKSFFKKALGITLLTSSLNAYSLTTIDVDTFINSLNGYITESDSALAQFDLENLNTGISEANNLAQCFGKGFDISTFKLDGLCSILSIGEDNLGFTSIGGFFSCVAGGGLSLPDLGGLCKAGVGSVTPSSSTTNPNGWEVNSGATETAIAMTPEFSIVDSNGGSKTKKIENVNFMGDGVDGEVLYGGVDGGEINRRANTIPSGSEANAVNNNDNQAIWLMEKAVASSGKNAVLEDYKLPKTKAKHLNSMSKIIRTKQGLVVDYAGAIGGMIKVVHPKYLPIEAESVEDYYKKEVDVFKKHMTLETDAFAKLIEMNELETKLSGIPKKTLLADNDGFIADPTEATGRKIEKSVANIFRMNSFFTVARESNLLNEHVHTAKIKNLLLQVTVKRGYNSSSLFPEQIARKEILDIVRKVDQTQR